MTKPSIVRKDTSFIQQLINANIYKCDGATYLQSRSGGSSDGIRSCDYTSLVRCNKDNQVACSYHSLPCNGESGHDTKSLDVNNLT